MINVSLPDDIEHFVSQTVAEGRYASEEEVVTDAIRYLRDSTIRHERLGKEIDAALAEVDQGLGIEIDSDDGLTAFFDEVEAEALADVATEKNRVE